MWGWKPVTVNFLVIRKRHFFSLGVRIIIIKKTFASVYIVNAPDFHLYFCRELYMKFRQTIICVFPYKDSVLFMSPRIFLFLVRLCSYHLNLVLWWHFVFVLLLDPCEGGKIWGCINQLRGACTSKYLFLILILIWD